VKRGERQGSGWWFSGSWDPASRELFTCLALRAERARTAFGDFDMWPGLGMWREGRESMARLEEDASQHEGQATISCHDGERCAS
jgi:hypothetical protein